MPYQIVLWLSAKKQKFDEGVTQKVAEPDFHDVDSALSCMLASVEAFSAVRKCATLTDVEHVGDAGILKAT